MQEGDFLIVDPAFEVNKRGTRDKNDGSEVVDDCDLPLDLELTERVEVDDETLPYAEDKWDCQNRLKLTKEYNLTFLSPYRHARAREEGKRRSTTRMARISSKTG